MRREEKIELILKILGNNGWKLGQEDRDKLYNRKGKIASRLNGHYDLGKKNEEGFLMREWMPKDEYKLYQKKISELCLQMGLKERRTRESIEYRTELETNFVFGEVIRLFDYDEHYYNAVVFFNKLVRSNSIYYERLNTRTI